MRISVRGARKEDIKDIMSVELRQFDSIGPASREVMRKRIQQCNSGTNKWFLVAEQDNAVVGYMILMPTAITPEDCSSWSKATGDGTLSTWDEKGDNIYVVSLAVLPNASEVVSAMLVYHSTLLWMAAGKSTYMFCARMPELRYRNKKTGITAEEWWQAKKDDGLPADWMLRTYTQMSGGQGPTRLLLNGYPPDSDSLGHGVLYVVTDPIKANKALKALFLNAGNKEWFDSQEKRLVKASTLYLPFGCPDWNRCRFCAMDSAVQLFRNLFYAGESIPVPDYINLASEALDTFGQRKMHSLFIFNAGSYFAMPEEVQTGVIDEVLRHQARSIKRLIIESRPGNITNDRIDRLINILRPAGVKLTVRIGLETQNEHLRNHMLRKGITHDEFVAAVKVLKRHNVESGAYILIKPLQMTDEETCIEAISTVDYAFDIGMDEVYLTPLCIGPGTNYEIMWRKGQLAPPSLWIVWRVLKQIANNNRYSGRVHILPFADEPPYLAIPSNHIFGAGKGVNQDMSNAAGCDKQFHSLFEQYRRSLDEGIFDSSPADCSCRPKIEL